MKFCTLITLNNFNVSAKSGPIHSRDKHSSKMSFFENLREIVNKIKLISIFWYMKHLDHSEFIKKNFSILSKDTPTSHIS